MTDDRPSSTYVATSLHEVNQRLADLMPRLARANQAFADAARPLNRLAEMDSAQKRALAEGIRAAEKEWEEVTQLVRQALAMAASLGDQPSTETRDHGAG
jgi:hypothetical protein